MTEDYSQFLSGSAHLRQITGEPESHGPMPREFVVWAYRLFLDREPENEHVVKEKAESLRDTQKLRRVFLDSDEFRIKNAEASPHPARPQAARGPMRVERITDRNALVDFFGHVQQTWSALGNAEPHWSVLSADKFKKESLAENLPEFYGSGRREVEAMQALLSRNDLTIRPHAECLEYGCGVGRVTRWLAPLFEQVIAFDISVSHLGLARCHMNGERVRNVRFEHIVDLESMQKLPPVDFFYSMIVLQHNPPPIIEVIIASLLEALRPGGIGLFQVPVYRAGYTFSVDAYLSGIKKTDGAKQIEMHLLPQSVVFELIAEAGCVPVEVFEDNWAGPGFVSNTFLVRRPDRRGG